MENRWLRKGFIKTNRVYAFETSCLIGLRDLFCDQVRNEFYKDTQGAMIVYDASDRASFDALDSWMAELKSDIGNPKDMENIVFVVCANKVNINCQPYFMLICSVMFLSCVFLFSVAKMN